MDYILSNKEAWEEAFEKHQQGWHYDIADKLADKDTLFLEPEVVEELKKIELNDRSIAQFCCNNGRELLSMIKLGAKSGIGFDIAENFIGEGNRIARKTGLNCEFVAGNIYNLDSRYETYFDLLFISIGALCWFHDLNLFFRKVSDVLKPGGTLLIHEQHPFTNLIAMVDEEGYDAENPEKPVYSYFKQEPWIETKGMDYIGGQIYDSKTFYSYSHTFSDILNSIVSNGIKITKLAESNRDISAAFGHLSGQNIPLSYILLGQKENLSKSASSEVHQ